MTTTLNAGVKWSVRARAEIPSFWINYQVGTDGGTLTTLEQDVRQKIENHVGPLDKFELRVYHSWVASDVMDCTFVVTPRQDIQTGDVSLWQGAFEGNAAGTFSPADSVGRWVLEGCNARKDVWAPYQVMTGPVWTDTLCVTEVAQLDELLRPAASESWVGGFARALNTVHSTNKEQDGSFASTVLAQHAAEKLTGWDVVPTWLKAIFIVLPLAIVVGGSIYIVRTGYSLVKG